MNKLAFFTFVALLLTSFSNLHAAEPPLSADGPYANETKEQLDARMAWWSEARFGMFIHWGGYARLAGSYNGKQIDNVGEWIMRAAKIPIADYIPAAFQFNPEKFGADDWSNPGGGDIAGPRWDPAQEGDYDDYIKLVAAPQVDKLIVSNWK